MSAKIVAVVLLSVGGSTIFGVVAGLFFKRIPHRANDIILGFAAGVMLAAAVLGLFAPALENGASSILPVICGAFAGAWAISMLDKIVPHLHKIAGLDASDNSRCSSASKTLLFVTAIALHKIPEGLATGVSFASENISDVLTVASSMSLQNIPEAIVIVPPLFAVGVSSFRTISISVAIAATSIVSVLAGTALAAVFASWAPFLLSAAGGAILYVISDEMIPETHSHGFEKPATFALISGLLLVMTLQRLI